VIFESQFLHAVAPCEGQAASLLQDSFTISRSLPIDDRAFLLLYLTDASVTICPQMTMPWAVELSGIVPHLKADWNRVAMAKNALLPLAKPPLVKDNVIFAFKSLAKIEAPIPSDSGYTEDVRADAAATIYVAYFRVAPGQFDNILKAAAGLGDSGEYPFRAAGLLIQELTRTTPTSPQAVQIFEQACEYYEKSFLDDKKPRFLDANPQFFQLLQSAQFSVPEPNLKNGLTTFVKYLLSEKSLEPEHYSGQVHTAEGVFSFQSQKELLLFKVFPIIKRIDPGWAAQLAEQRKQLTHADTELSPTIASASIGSTPIANLPAVSERMRQQMLIRHIQNLRDNDPLAALEETKLLSDDSKRMAVISSLVPAVNRVDKAKAAAAYNEIRVVADGLPEGAAKVRAMVAAAKAAYSLGDLKGCTDYVSKAYDYGVQVFSDSMRREPNELLISQDAYLDLLELTDFAGERLGARLVPKIQSLKNSGLTGLQGHLLLGTAKGLGKAHSTSSLIAGK
jgi:hypothetical protein